MSTFASGLRSWLIWANIPEMQGALKVVYTVCFCAACRFSIVARDWVLLQLLFICRSAISDQWSPLFLPGMLQILHRHEGNDIFLGARCFVLGGALPSEPKPSFASSRFLLSTWQLCMSITRLEQVLAQLARL